MVTLLRHETPEFISPDLGPAISPDLNPVDYKIRGVMQERMYQTPIRYVVQLKHRLIEVWSESNRTLSKRRLTSDANDFVPVLEPMEYTLSISCDFCLMQICEIKF